MASLKSLNLNKFMQPIGTPVTRLRRTPGMDFDYLYEVQTRRMSASRVNLEGFVKEALAGDATADFSAGSALSLSTEITYNIPFQKKPMFAQPFLSIFQGATLTSANQIYPDAGGSITTGRYIVQGDMDALDWDQINMKWSGLLVDTTGTSSQLITFRAGWSYLDYTAGTAL